MTKTFGPASKRWPDVAYWDACACLFAHARSRSSSISISKSFLRNDVVRSRGAALVPCARVEEEWLGV
jgi:hypothetical protein